MEYLKQLRKEHPIIFWSTVLITFPAGMWALLLSGFLDD